MTYLMMMGLTIALAAGPDPDAMRQVYHQGVKQFKQKKYAAAKQSFEKLLPWLQQTQKKRKQATKAWHLMTLGQCDVYHFLGRIAEAGGKQRQACRHYRQMTTLFKTVPGTWKSWNVNPSLPAHLTVAKSQWSSMCPGVPSLLKLKVEPANARIELQVGGQWQPVQGQQISTTDTTLQLRVTADGYEPKTFEKMSLPRWQVVVRTIKLEKKKVVAIVRRPPPRIKPTATPVYKKAWFWAVIGTGVAVGAAAVIIPTVAYVNRGTVLGCGDGAFRIGGCQ